MERDDRVESAIAHGSYRFVANGVPLADFNDVAAKLTRWDDWCAAWVERGAVHEALGRAALAGGRFLSAGEHLTTAAACYHFGKFLFVHDTDQMSAAHLRAVTCRTDALAFLVPPGERLEIPYEGTTLKGNLRKPVSVARPPLVVMVMGLDSAKEEMDTNERVFLDRGMATLAFDGPGQGEAEYELPICPEYERPLAAVLDWAETRADLDVARVGVWGVSLGGYYAPRAAAFEPRLRACVAISGPFDLAAVFDRLPAMTRAAFTARAFAGDGAEARAVAARMTLTGVASRITCPLYVVGARLDGMIPPADAERLADEAGGATVLNMIEDGTHIASNRTYRYRTQSADWMAEQLEVE